MYDTSVSKEPLQWTVVKGPELTFGWQDFLKALAMYEETLANGLRAHTTEQVATACGCTTQTFHRRLKEYDLWVKAESVSRNRRIGP